MIAALGLQGNRTRLMSVSVYLLRRPFLKSTKITIPELLKKKQQNEPITMLTAYDFPMASQIDEAGVDIILVGDSLAMVVLGYDSTLPVTMEDMLHHSKAVSRAVKRALVIGDMPFMSYQVSTEKAVENAGRFLKEAGCDAVKLEGGKNVVDKIEAIVKAGIPVMGHIGLTPQSATALGGYKVQGKDLNSAKELIEDAISICDAGVFAIVLECVPDELARVITQKVKVPTIGIGAGPYCDGQVLVTNDLLGLYEKFIPSFVKRYINLAPEIKKALSSYVSEVKERKFPSEKHSFKASKELIEALKSWESQN